MMANPAFQILPPSEASITHNSAKKISNPPKSTNRLNKTPKIGRWSEEARAKQAERIRLQKPWEHSTGPKTEAGKKKTSRNAVKHGHRSARTKRFKKILRDAKVYLKKVKALNRMDRQRRRAQYQIELQKYRQLLLGIPADRFIPRFYRHPERSRGISSIQQQRGSLAEFILGNAKHCPGARDDIGDTSTKLKTSKNQYSPAPIRLAMRGTMSNLFP